MTEAAIPPECPGTNSEQAGKSNACYGCPNQSRCASGEAAATDPDREVIRTRFSGVQRVLFVVANKGGCGKSAIAAQLAQALAAGVVFDSDGEEPEVAILDADVTGPSIPHLLSTSEEEVHQSGTGWQPVYVRDNLAVMSIGFMLPSKNDAIAWRGARKTGLLKQFLRDVDWGEHVDWLVIDMPPGTTDEHITLSQSLSGIVNTAALIVATPQEVALMDVRKQVSFCQRAKIPIIGVVENMSYYTCRNCGHREQIFSPTTGGVQAMCSASQIRFLGSIPLDPVLMKACENGESIQKYDCAARDAINQLAQEVAKHFPIKSLGNRESGMQ
jgi:Mrp family chromosome partitioning ATPase